MITVCAVAIRPSLSSTRGSVVCRIEANKFTPSSFASAEEVDADRARAQLGNQTGALAGKTAGLHCFKERSTRCGWQPVRRFLRREPTPEMCLQRTIERLDPAGCITD